MTTKIRLDWGDIDQGSISRTSWGVENVIWELEHLKSHLQTEEVKDYVKELTWAALTLDKVYDYVRDQQRPKRPAREPFAVEVPVSAS